MVSDNLKILLVLSIVFMYQIQIYFLNRSQIEVLLSRTTSHMPHPMPITLYFRFSFTLILEFTPSIVIFSTV